MRPAPTLKKPEKWSPSFIDFMSKCLVKNPDQRANAPALLHVSYGIVWDGMVSCKGVSYDLSYVHQKFFLMKASAVFVHLRLYITHCAQPYFILSCSMPSSRRPRSRRWFSVPLSTRQWTYYREKTPAWKKMMRYISLAVWYCIVSSIRCHIRRFRYYWPINHILVNIINNCILGDKLSLDH